MLAGKSTVAVSVSPKQIKYGFITVRSERWKTLRAMMLLDIVYLDEDLRCDAHPSPDLLAIWSLCATHGAPLLRQCVANADIRTEWNGLCPSPPHPALHRCTCAIVYRAKVAERMRNVSKGPRCLWWRSD